MYYQYWDRYSELAESALKHVKTAMQNSLYTTEVKFILINHNLEVVLVNRHASKVVGYEENQIIGKDILGLFIPEDMLPKVKNFSNKLLAGEINNTETTQFQNIVLTKKGEKRFIEYNAIPLRDDTSRINGILFCGEDVTDRIQTQQNMIKQAKKELEETFDTINDAITIHDNHYNIVRANKAAVELFGTSFSEIKKMKCYNLYHGSDSPPPNCPCAQVLNTGKTVAYKVFDPHLNKNLEIKAIPRLDAKGKIFGMVHIAKDISDDATTEEKQHLPGDRLMHTQKMESIGRLAGGVAHDFNNLLSGILGFSELALLDIPKDHPSRERIKLILGLGEKASSITNQLLAFSSRQLLVINNICINDLIADMADMLKLVVGEDILLELKPAVTVKNIMADKDQIEQILLNLAANARDAMPNGGILTIETADIFIDECENRQINEVKPGEYIKLVIRDNGCGMDSEVLANIFEPFYTTKEFGKGTGLGLSSAYGIIKQHNGFIDVTSKINEGTTFNIYLPVSENDAEQAIDDKDQEQLLGNG